MAEKRTDEVKAQNYAAMLNDVSVINSTIATHDKCIDPTGYRFGVDSHEDYVFEMTHDEKKARVSKSMSYLKQMVALEDWGSEDMTDVNAAIKAGTTFVG
jgi:hypothetical protein